MQIYKNLYPTRTDSSDPGYPSGKAVDAVAEGTGTPATAAWVNDFWGAFQAVLAEGGMAPNATPEKVGSSQVLDALKNISATDYTFFTAFNDNPFDLVGWATQGYAANFATYAVGGADTLGTGVSRWQCVGKDLAAPTVGVTDEVIGSLTVKWSGGALYVQHSGGWDKFSPYGRISAEAYGSARAQILLDAVKRGAVLEGGSLTLSEQVSITLEEGENVRAKLDKLDGGFALVIDNTLSAAVSAVDVSRFDNHVEVTSATGFAVGQYIQIYGTVGHEVYTPARYTACTYCAKIRAIDTNTLKLDRPIPYILTAVTVSRAASSSVEFDVASLESATLSISNVPRVKSNIDHATGDVGDSDGARFLNIANAAYCNSVFVAENAKCVFGALYENISAGKIEFYGAYVGNTVDTKSFRSNGLCYLQISITNLASLKKSVDLQGGRDCQLKIIDTSNGAEFFDSGSTAPNRLEAVNLLECDRCNCDVNITDANDQGFEFVSCTDSELSGFVSQSTRSTGSEGCVVFKGFSRDLRLSAIVRATNTAGLKIENFNGQQRVHVLPSADIYSATNAAIVSRDAVTPYDTGHVIQGTLSRGNAGELISLRADNNACTVDITGDLENATLGVNVEAEKCMVSVTAKNTLTHKKLVNIADTALGFMSGVIQGDSLDVYIEYNGAAIDEFSFATCALMQGKIFFSGIDQVFKVRGGEFYSSIIPTNGAFVNGDRYTRESYNVIGTTETLFGADYKLVELGRVYGDLVWRPVFGFLPL